MRGLVLALVLALPLAGCFKAEAPLEHEEDDGLDEGTRATLLALAAPKPTRYSFPLQRPLPEKVVYFNGSLTTLDAAQGYEAPQDRGGTSYNTLFLVEDVSAHVPPDQPVLVEVRLWYNNGPGRGADLDIFLDLPGVRGHESRAFFDEWSWTLPVKTALVSTVGVEGEPALLGIQAANGKILPGQTLDYTMRVTFRYFADVLTPHVPYEVVVPAGASGLIVQSVKHAGDVHIDAGITIVGPDERLVAHVAFNDLSIPTEAMHIPVREAGPHVVYLTHAKGGFLALRSDVPLDEPEARPLVRTVVREVLVSESVVPGVAEHTVYGNRVTPFTAGATVSFDAPGNFPLELRPVLEGDGADVAGDVECRITSEAGLVSLYRRTARYDDERGRVGFSDETSPLNRAFHPANLTGGPYTLGVVVAGSTARVAVETVSYQR